MCVSSSCRQLNQHRRAVLALIPAATCTSWPMKGWVLVKRLTIICVVHAVIVLVVNQRANPDC